MGGGSPVLYTSCLGREPGRESDVTGTAVEGCWERVLFSGRAFSPSDRAQKVVLRVEKKGAFQRPLLWPALQFSLSGRFGVSSRSDWFMLSRCAQCDGFVFWLSRCARTGK